MQTNQELQIAASLSLLEKIVAAICVKPDKLSCDVNIGNSLIRVKLTAHPDDVGKIVGSGGEGVTALYSLARLLLSDSGRRVEIEKVAQTDDLKAGYSKFKFIDKWNKSKVEKLLKETVEICFHCKVIIETKEVKDGNIEMIAKFEDAESERGKILGKAISVLFLNVGKNCGRVTYCDVARL